LHAEIRVEHIGDIEVVLNNQDFGFFFCHSGLTKS